MYTSKGFGLGSRHVKNPVFNGKTFLTDCPTLLNIFVEKY